MKRLRHLPIVCGPTPSCVATTALLGSRSHASTILARIVSAAGSERDRVMAISCVRSSLEIVSIAFGRPVRIGYLLQSGYPKPMQLLCYELKGQNTSTQHHIDKISSALSNELNQVSATALHTLMQCREYIDELIAVVTEKQKEAETSVRALATSANAAIRQAQGVRQKLEEMRNSI